MSWSKEETKYLMDNYDKFSLRGMQEQLFFIFYSERTIGSIKLKAFRMRLKK